MSVHFQGLAVCSNCGCREAEHNQPADPSWPGHLGCDNHPLLGYCWGGFDTAPGGTHKGTCTHRNGHKDWCSQGKRDTPPTAILTPPHCECGAASVGSPHHSGWCPLAGQP